MKSPSAASAPPVPPPVDFSTFVSDTNRTIDTNSRHFLGLSFLFLFPLSFSISIFPSLLSHALQHNNSLLYTPTNTIFLSSFFALFAFTFSILATASISHSFFHALYKQPVKLMSSIGSAFASFFPLLITVILTQLVVLAQILVLAIFLASGLFLFSVFKGVDIDELVSFQVSFSSPNYTLFSQLFLIIFIPVFVYLQLNWILVCVIVVVESKFGLETLKRSYLLMEGVKKLAFRLFVPIWILVGMIIWANSSLTLIIGAGDGWKSFAFVGEIVQNSFVIAMLFRYSIAASAVLYIHCRAAHGELDWDEKFAQEYVSVPSDDGKASHVVPVACA